MRSALPVIASALAAGAMLFLTTAPTHAQATFFSDRSAFLANTTGTTTIDFEGLAPDNSYTFYPLPAGITLSGVNFSVDPSFMHNALGVIGKGFYYQGNSVLSSQSTTAANGDLLITFSAPVTAIGLDYYNDNSNTDIFTLSDGEVFSRPTGNGHPSSFVGLISNTPITTLDIQAKVSYAINIDNFTFGKSAPVPETSSVISLGLLLALGLGALTVNARRRKAVH